MNKLTLFLLLFCATTFAQERYEYKYGQNNSNISTEILGMNSNLYPDQVIIQLRECPASMSENTRSVHVKTPILDTVYDFINHEQKITRLLKDIHPGKYVIWVHLFTDPDCPTDDKYAGNNYGKGLTIEVTSDSDYIDINNML